MAQVNTPYFTSIPIRTGEEFVQKLQEGETKSILLFVSKTATERKQQEMDKWKMQPVPRLMSQHALVPVILCTIMCQTTWTCLYTSRD